jgi:hypothetical protein
MPITRLNYVEIIKHLSELFVIILVTSPIVLIIIIPVWFIRPEMLVYATFFALLAITPLVMCTVSDRGIVLFKWHYHGIPTAAEEAHKEDMDF